MKVRAFGLGVAVVLAAGCGAEPAAPVTVTAAPVTVTATPPTATATATVTVTAAPVVSSAAAVTTVPERAADLNEVLGALESAGVTCDSWGADPTDFDAWCKAPDFRVFHDKFAPGDMGLMDSTGKLWMSIYRSGGVIRGENWIVGAEASILGDVTKIGGRIGYP